MSVTVTDWQRAWRDADLPATLVAGSRTVSASAVKHTLMFLSTYADYRDGSKAYPSVERLATKTQQGRQVVMRALQIGRDHGWIERMHHRPGTREVDVYALRLPPDVA